MTDKLKLLVARQKISRIEYLSYLLYEANDLGREYLSKMTESMFLETPIEPREDSFAWHDGRKSVLRDVKATILRINKLMEEEHDGSSQRFNERIDPNQPQYF